MEKPERVARDPAMSAKWDELAAGRDLPESAAPVLALLCRWHAVADRCAEDMDDAGGMVAYQDDRGELKPLPQVAALKQASAEIRALTKMLDAACEPAEEPGEGARDAVVNVIRLDRRAKARAAGA